jgi:hypothetical protein
MHAQGLTVSHAAGHQQKTVRVGNISPTGLYLFAENPWEPGTVVLFIMGEKSSFETLSRSQVKLWTKCVRVDANGAGLAFLHSHVDQTKWLEAMSRAPSMISESGPVPVFRLTRALAFLFHISPASEAGILKLMTENLTREGIERAIETALQASDMMESQNCASRSDVASPVVLRILERVADIEEEERREYWARLLAACSLDGSEDELNLTLVSLLSKLNLFHLRILSAAWSEASNADARAGEMATAGVHCSVQEAQAITGLASAEGVEGIVNDLHQLGLIGNTAKTLAFDRLAEVNLSLTDLGLKFCERCCRQGESGRDENKNFPTYEQYVPLEGNYAVSTELAGGMSNSLASEAQAIRQGSGVALID